MNPFEEMFDEPPQERNTLGVLDGSLTVLGVALLGLVPTLLASVFWPRALAPMVRQSHPRGLSGIFIAPGAFFVLSMIAVTITVSRLVPESGGMLIQLGSDLGSATEAGEIWRVASTMLPLFVLAVVIGGLTHLGAKLTRWEDWPLDASIRGGFYAVVGLSVWMMALEVLTASLAQHPISWLREAVAMSGLAVAVVWVLFGLTNRSGACALRRIAGLVIPSAGLTTAASYAFSLG
ncbi:MAG: hypothetical protein AAGH41_12700 [Pseudomonadota bacterium]